jgi:hypothetical protein
MDHIFGMTHSTESLEEKARKLATGMTDTVTGIIGWSNGDVCQEKEGQHTGG